MLVFRSPLGRRVVAAAVTVAVAAAAVVVGDVVLDAVTADSAVQVAGPMIN